MNCKPNDLAIVVKSPGPMTACIVGKVLRVTRPVFDGEPCWEYEGPRLVVPGWQPLDLIEDDFLKPLRDPGEDAVDETLRWVDVPLTASEVLHRQQPETMR